MSTVVQMIMEASATTELSLWARSGLLQLIMLVSGSILVARLVAWGARILSERVDLAEADDNLVRSEEAKRKHALIQVLSWALVVLIYVLAGVRFIQLLGFSLTAIIPAATVAGVAVGFGAQRIVQDLLAGFFLFAERQYGYGDLIRIAVVGVPNAVIGTVEEVSLRTTTVRTHAGEVVITPNGQIVQTTNLSRGWARAVIDVPVPATVDVNAVNDILRDVGAQAYRDEQLGDLLLDEPAVMGVESMEVDQFQVRIVARTLPGRQFEVGRTMRSMITARLLAEGIVTAAELATGEPTGAS